MMGPAYATVLVVMKELIVKVRVTATGKLVLKKLTYIFPTKIASPYDDDVIIFYPTGSEYRRG